MMYLLLPNSAMSFLHDGMDNSIFCTLTNALLHVCDLGGVDHSCILPQSSDEVRGVGL